MKWSLQCLFLVMCISLCSSCLYSKEKPVDTERIPLTGLLIADVQRHRGVVGYNVSARRHGPNAKAQELQINDKKYSQGVGLLTNSSIIYYLFFQRAPLPLAPFFIIVFLGTGIIRHTAKMNRGCRTEIGCRCHC